MLFDDYISCLMNRMHRSKHKNDVIIDLVKTEYFAISNSDGICGILRKSLLLKTVHDLVSDI